MKDLLIEIKEELQNVLSGKTIDAMISPFVFFLANSFFSLYKAIILAFLLALMIGIIRVKNKENWRYAFAGLIGLLVAAFFAYLTSNAVDYFIPKIISSLFGVSIILFSMIIGKPLAIYASHLSRAWPMDWYFRKDVKPAYREVTFFWTLYLSVRLILLTTLYFKGRVWRLVWMNTLLGLPATVIILTLSYVYGMYRLKKLEGPSIEEYKSGKNRPWKGQRRGF